MNIGIVGLGLIGGSFAKAYKKCNHNVYVYDINKDIISFAQLEGNVDGFLDENTIKKCDLILISVYPKIAIEYLKENAKYINKNTIVIDCCGTKEMVCDACFEIAKQYGFTFVGGHPMAGSHRSGYKYSRPTLYKGASMIIISPYNDMEFFDKIKNLLKPAEFGRITVTTAKEHDKIIAFTSQMAHVVSNAFIKSPTALEHKGYSAGSYRDLTRVAYLNEEMWTELFFENKNNLIYELDVLIKELKKYHKALKNDDEQTLKALLKEGKDRKREVDGL